jgi:hypothetical protein
MVVFLLKISTISIFIYYAVEKIPECIWILYIILVSWMFYHKCSIWDVHDPFYPWIHMYIPSLKRIYKNNLVFNINIKKRQFKQHAFIYMNMHDDWLIIYLNVIYCNILISQSFSVHLCQVEPLTKLPVDSWVIKQHNDLIGCISNKEEPISNAYKSVCTYVYQYVHILEGNQILRVRVLVIND